MGVFDQFPYTNLHELNLDWVLQNTKSLLAELENVKADLAAMQKYFDDFTKNLDEKIDQQIADKMRVEMSLYMQRVVAVENELKRVEEKLTGQYDEVTADLKSLHTELTNLSIRMTTLVNELRNDLMQIQQDFHDYKNSLDAYIDSRMSAAYQELLERVIHLDRLNVINPITGFIEDIQSVLNQLYNLILQSFALTAQEYDDLKLTARTYDNMRIKAIDYDSRGWFIFWELTQGVMRNPFTGLMQHYSVPIYTLADLHRYSLTCKGYDDLKLSAQDYDDKQITAFQFDFGSLNYLGAPAPDTKITAERYDDLRYDAFGRVYVQEQLARTAGGAVRPVQELYPANNLPWTTVAAELLRVAPVSADAMELNNKNVSTRKRKVATRKRTSGDNA